MSDKGNPYKILELGPDANQNEIQQAYKRLAMRYHPDRSKDKNAETKFKMVQQAYKILKNEDSKKEYDQTKYGSSDSTPKSTSPRHGKSSRRASKFAQKQEPKSKPKPKMRKGKNLELEFEIDLEDLFVDKYMEYRSPVGKYACHACGGAGGRNHAMNCPRSFSQYWVTCPVCCKEDTCRTSEDGFYCHNCKKNISADFFVICNECNGNGYKETCIMSIRLPREIEDGLVQCFERKGRPGSHGGKPGDLYIKFKIRPHPVFTYDPPRIICRFPIPLSLATIGGVIQVPVPGGVKDLHIPPGTKHGDKFDIRVHYFQGKEVIRHVCYIVEIETPGGLHAGLTRRFQNMEKTINDNIGYCKQSSIDFDSGNGENIDAELYITLEEAMKGGLHEFALHKLVPCEYCDWKEQDEMMECNYCSLEKRYISWKIRFRDGKGHVLDANTCKRCLGKGRICCPDGGWSGFVHEPKYLTVRIPAGLKDGDSILFKKEGERNLNGKKPGDLRVTIRYLPHDVFIANGRNLESEIKISITKAACGGELPIPTLNGSRLFTIPPGTQSGTLFKITGAGMCGRTRESPGDLIIKVVVCPPDRISQRQLNQLTKLEKMLCRDKAHHLPNQKDWDERFEQFKARYN